MDLQPIAMYTESSAPQLDFGSQKPRQQQVPFDQFYDLENTTQFLINKGYKKVALQFPDALLQDSTQVVQFLTLSVPQAKFYILGDTSYGSECVDEVAAEHIKADCIIHYGQATLTMTSRLPVFYVFGNGKIDIQQAAESFLKYFTKDQEVVVFFECGYHYAIADFEKTVRESNDCPTLYATKINRIGEVAESEALQATLLRKQNTEETDTTQLLLPSPTQPEIQKAETPKAIPSQQQTTEASQETTETETPSTPTNPETTLAVVETPTEENFSYCGYYLDTPLNMEGKTIFFIGSEGSLLINLMMSFPSTPAVRYDPEKNVLKKEEHPTNRQLQKRFFLIEKCKDVKIFGILVGTLAVAQYLDLIQYMKQIITDAGKKYYTIVVGKLNVAKLANFSEIDMFVLIAGPDNTLIDSQEYFKPIITPFELEIALVKYASHQEQANENQGKSWDTQYTTDFNVILKNRHRLNESLPVEDDVQVSLVSGSITSNPKFPKTSQEIVHQKLEMQEYTAAKLFLERSFRGLEQNIGQTPVSLAIEGQSGLPFTGYTTEPTLGQPPVEKKKPQEPEVAIVKEKPKPAPVAIKNEPLSSSSDGEGQDVVSLI